MMVMRNFCCLVLFLLLGIPAHAGAVDDLRRFMKETHSLEAEFEQTVVQAEGAGKRNVRASQGSMAYQKPGRFRWSADHVLIVGDGSKVWLFDQDLQQVTVKKLDRALGTTPAALLAGSGNLEAFTLREDGESDGFSWVNIEPKEQDAPFVQMRMGFKNGELKALEMLDPFNQVIALTLRNVKRNPKLPASHFIFTPPANADVLED
ncbi:MAG: outer membrane lipoprotein chaperone LolA [Zoogloeaceae bacterium]|jgi:outer membrane lipoprotein carrier protein|nr:outer membrane lipoprotein chaperone LolA [Zoogloeaceae bacterium]